jgi:hypothetical protein
LESLQNRLAFLKQRCLFFISADEVSGLSYEDFALSQGSLNRDLGQRGLPRRRPLSRLRLSPPSFRVEDQRVLAESVEAFGDSRGGILLSFDPIKGA